MRKSLAPSQVKVTNCTVNNLSSSAEGSRDKHGKNSLHLEDDDNYTIQRLPVVSFLSIPPSLNRSFVLPKGCIVTAESLALRKIKTLGPRKHFQPYIPGSSNAPLPLVGRFSEQEEEEDDPLVENIPANKVPPFEPLVLWQDPNDSSIKVEVVPSLACKLRPHQREGVQFLFECTMGLRGFEGNGCVLADDMGLGKTLMSITVMWTLLQQGFVKGQSAARKVMVVCPTSLVGNWDNEIKKWVGEGCNTFACKSEPKRIIENFLNHRGKGVLIISYETQRRYSDMFTAPSSRYKSGNDKSCDLLICDEAHKLKNAESGLAKSLNLLPAKMRILLSGTPMQNELTEFYNMVNFCNPGVIGNTAEFRKKYERPILAAREAGASEAEVCKARDLQNELSTIVNEFMLKRGNILNAQHLPPKLVQYVCCQLTDLQRQIYDSLLASKHMRHVRDGRDNNALNSIRHLINICSHPRMIVDSYREKLSKGEDDEILAELAVLLPEVCVPARGAKHSASSSSSAASRGPLRSTALKASSSSSSSTNKHVATGTDGYVDPAESGKMFVLYRLMQTMRAMKEGERIVVISNYTSTLDVVERMCQQFSWPFLRLDGTTNGQKRTKLVAEFNDPHSGAFAFLLSSKAGGCGINLIGGNRLVLLDSDWNPASDKQAAGRIWREGQRRRCYIYRFMSTCTIEEKIVQRQLSKEGLQNIVENKDQVNVFSTGELKALFGRRTDSRSDTHDTLRCKKCASVKILSSSSSSSSSAFTEKHIQECSAFIQSFIACIREEAEEKSALDAVAPYLEDFESIHTQLINKTFTSLPLFSRGFREAVNGVDREIEDLKVLRPFSVMNAFLSRWQEFIPVLTDLSLAKPVSESGEAQVSDESVSEYVEQEGCPEEEDLNRWSHHCSVSTCDDAYLKTALADDTTVSFVFGLEVNWDLLQTKQEETREVELVRKEQAKEALDSLNKRRQAARDKKDSSNSCGVTKLDESPCDSELQSTRVKATTIIAKDDTVLPDDTGRKKCDRAVKVSKKKRVVMSSDDDSDEEEDEERVFQTQQQAKSTRVNTAVTNAAAAASITQEKANKTKKSPLQSRVREAVCEEEVVPDSDDESSVDQPITSRPRQPEPEPEPELKLKRLSRIVIDDGNEEEEEVGGNAVSRLGSSRDIGAKHDSKPSSVTKKNKVRIEAASEKANPMKRPLQAVVAEKENIPVKKNSVAAHSVTGSGEGVSCEAEWSCAVCTYMNPFDTQNCQMCSGTRRVTRRRGS